MGYIQSCCQSFFALFNGLVIVVGLAITGISLYFAVEQGRNGVFGSYSQWIIWTPFTMGLVASIFACCACGLRWQDKQAVLFCYGFLLFSFGVVVAAAGGFQVVAIDYQLEISETADLRALQGGFQDARQHLSDYNLGLFNLCCMGNETALYNKCAENSPPLCYHEFYYYDLALGEDEDMCNRVSELALCPNPSSLDDVQDFNVNVYTYAEETFLIAAYMFCVFGGILLLTCFGACQTGRRNKIED